MNNIRITLLNWVATGDLDQNNLEQALKLSLTKPTKQQWLHYLTTGLLWAAVLFNALGIIFFFAFNWQDMGRFSKFGLIEAIMLLCAPLLFKVFSSRILIITSLMGMSLLTGALLALVGQTYQTGADPWQLFTTWAVFILPWAFIARSDALWSLWIILLNTALYFYLDIHHSLFGFLNHDELNALAFSALNTFLLLSFELHYYQHIKKQPSSHRYLHQLLALLAGSAISFLAIHTIFDSHSNLLYFAYYLLWLGAAYVYYRHKQADLLILSAATLSVIMITISWLIETIGSRLDNSGFFIITIAIITLSALAGKWLKSVAKAFKEQAS